MELSAVIRDSSSRVVACVHDGLSKKACGAPFLSAPARLLLEMVLELMCACRKRGMEACR